jgi:hypothetical protein
MAAPTVGRVALLAFADTSTITVVAAIGVGVASVGAAGPTPGVVAVVQAGAVPVAIAGPTLAVFAVAAVADTPGVTVGHDAGISGSVPSGSGSAAAGTRDADVVAPTLDGIAGTAVVGSTLSVTSEMAVNGQPTTAGTHTVPAVAEFPAGRTGVVVGGPGVVSTIVAFSRRTARSAMLRLSNARGSNPCKGC